MMIIWADEPVCSITDIAYFALGEAAESVPDATDDRDPVTMLVVPSSIEIQHTASLPESAYLRALQEGKLLGARTGQDGKVYFPAREADPATGLQLNEFLELPDKGTVTTFAIINIPFAGQRIKPPYVAAYVLLDGADIAFLHCPFRELAEAYPELVCNLHRGICEGVVSSVGGGTVRDFGTLYDRDPCRVTVGVAVS